VFRDDHGLVLGYFGNRDGAKRGQLAVKTRDVLVQILEALEVRLQLLVCILETDLAVGDFIDLFLDSAQVVLHP